MRFYLCSTNGGKLRLWPREVSSCAGLHCGESRPHSQSEVELTLTFRLSPMDLFCIRPSLLVQPMVFGVSLLFFSFFAHRLHGAEESGSISFHENYGSGISIQSRQLSEAVGAESALVLTALDNIQLAQVV